MMRFPYWRHLAILLLLIYPFSGLESVAIGALATPIGSQLDKLFFYAILALGLNVCVGYSGLLHLGIAAFFGIGAYIAAILTTPSHPFQMEYFTAVALATVGAAVLGVALGAPTLRLRGDYLALVTLGFGEVVKAYFINLDNITRGAEGLTPIPSPDYLNVPLNWLSEALGQGPASFHLHYYLNLTFLVLAVVVLRNLENSRLGRAWVALREDELALTCMGVSATRVKLSAFAIGCGLAGLAGALYAFSIGSVSPTPFDFNLSAITLCCVILGGLGSIDGVLLGTGLLYGFDRIVSPLVDSAMPEWIKQYFTIGNWRLMIFGLALILMMRFRPEGIIPSKRVQRELHEFDAKGGAA
ncbi:MAG: branched-chain amino acid ABC transporter permease [Gemmataceae bacterium]|nr:branched-chain amino acid ABC transporter permease [Gemmataceae bacterium]